MFRFRLGYYLIIIIIVAAIFCFQDKIMDHTVNKSDYFLVQLKPFDFKNNKISSAYLAEKKTIVKRFLEKNWTSDSETLSFLIAKNGQIIYEHYQGIADKLEAIPISATTPLHIASVSKVLTATAILQLVAADKIKLDQPVNSILEDFPYQNITIRTLLNHRSGLQNYTYYLDKINWDKKKIITNREILKTFKKNNVPLSHAVNSRFNYCNTNYAFLALVIEKITGMPYPTAMKKMIFDPLDMRDTFVYSQSINKKIAPSYLANGTEIPIGHLDAVYGDKNIYATPRDLLKFDNALYNPDFLTPSLVQEIYAPYSFENKGQKNYGLGIRMVLQDGKSPFYYHNGWWHGNTSAYIHLKKEKVVIIALSNKFSKKPYRAKMLATYFGNYPFKDDAELE